MKARLLVELDVKADEADAFAEMFKKEFVARSRGEAGCEFYELWRDAGSPAKMTIVEVWTSQAHLDTHLAQPWFAEWAPKLEAALATPFVVRQLVSAEE